MGVEIERKFLINSTHLKQWESAANGYLTVAGHLFQGYLGFDPWVRIRTIDGMRAELTIKGPGSLSKAEFNYAIPLQDALDLMPLVKARLSKVRYHFSYKGSLWEIDRFEGDLDGRWLAEVELPREDTQFEKPPWVGREVTEDPRYSNAQLAQQGWPRD